MNELHITRIHIHPTIEAGNLEEILRNICAQAISELINEYARLEENLDKNIEIPEFIIAEADLESEDGQRTLLRLAVTTSGRCSNPECQDCNPSPSKAAV